MSHPPTAASRTRVNVNAYQHEFKPNLHSQSQQQGPVKSHAQPQQQQQNRSPQPPSSTPPQHDGFAPRGLISSTLAEARAFVTQMDTLGPAANVSGVNNRLTANTTAASASLSDPSRPYTPRVVRKSGVTSPYTRTPNTPGIAEHFPASPSPSSGVADDSPLTRPSIHRATSLGTSSTRSRAYNLSSTGQLDQEMQELDLRPDSRLGTAVGGSRQSGGGSRPESTGRGGGKNITTAIPGGVQVDLSSTSTTAFPFPSSGTDEDWRQVESVQGDETSRPGTALIKPAVSGKPARPEITVMRQGSMAGRNSGGGGSAGIASPVSPQPPQSPAPPSAPRPTSVSRPRSRPTSSNSTGDSQNPKTPTRPNSGMFARPLSVGTGESNASASPPTSTSTSDDPPPDIAQLRALYTTYQNSSVVEKPDALRQVFTATHRALTALTQAVGKSSTNSSPSAQHQLPLIFFSFLLPPSDASLRIHILSSRLLFELSRDQANDALLLGNKECMQAMIQVLQQPVKYGMKTVYSILGVIHNLSVDGCTAIMNTNEEQSASQHQQQQSSSPLISQHLLSALAILLHPATHRALKLVNSNTSTNGEGERPSSSSSTTASDATTSGGGDSEAAKLCVEVTAILRNIACVREAVKNFIVPVEGLMIGGAGGTAATKKSSSTTTDPPPCLLDLLCSLTITYSSHSSLLLNLTRILSKLSLNQGCRQVMYSPRVGVFSSAASSPRSATTSSTPSSSPSSFLTSLLHSLQVHHVKLSLCIRILYILGNLTMQNDAARIAIVEGECGVVVSGAVTTTHENRKETDEMKQDSNFTQPQIETVRGLEILLSLLARSYQRDSKLRKILAGTGGATTGAGTGANNTSTITNTTTPATKKHHSMLRENEDLLIKLIRLLANLSITPSLGPQILADRRIVILMKLLKAKNLEVCEELVLNTVSAVTNLSFYLQHSSAGSASRPTSAAASTAASTTVAPASSADTSDTLFFHPSRDVLSYLLSYLFSSNVELLSESCRSLGNFSRSLSFRYLMVQARVDEVLVLLLDHNNTSVIYGAIGVILNIAAHQEGQDVLWKDDAEALKKCVELIERFGVAAAASNGEQDGNLHTQQQQQQQQQHHSHHDSDHEGDHDDEEDHSSEDGGSDDISSGDEHTIEWPLLSMLLKTFLNLRTSATSPSAAAGGGGKSRPISAVNNNAQMILKPQVPDSVRFHLLEVLEELLDRMEQIKIRCIEEQEAVAHQQQQHELDVITLPSGFEEVEKLASLLLNSCVGPTK